MDLRQFFTTQCWWGKLIGAFFGFLIFGATGALLGIIIGNLFDRGLNEHYASTFWYYRTEKEENIRHIFFTALFTILGHMAKADGRVSPQAIDMAKSCMHEMHLNAKHQQMAQQLFNRGKQPDFDLTHMLVPLYSALYQRPQLLKLFIETQYQAAQLNGLSSNKIYLMNQILRGLNFAPLQQQRHVFDEFASEAYRYHSSARQQEQTSRPVGMSPGLQNAYTALGLSMSATQQDIKRAYRRLMSRHHPDKLMAKGATQQQIQAANDKTQQIRKAYELICNANGW